MVLPGSRTMWAFAPLESMTQMRNLETEVSNRSKAIFVPSGDQSGDESGTVAGWWVSGVGVPPPALTTQIESVAEGTYRSNTTLEPSGENLGLPSLTPGPGVSGASPVPSEWTVYRWWSDPSVRENTTTARA